MSFLAPWFLVGFALIAGPIVAHLIRRATRERVVFSGLRFLRESPPRLNRRSRLEHPWLLALRCLIVGVLAFGFARPYWRGVLTPPVATVAPQSVVAVLDESASMQRTGLWAAAQQKIIETAAALGPADQFVLLAASGGTTELIRREQWARTLPAERTALVRSVLAARAPGWGPKNLDTAMAEGAAEWETMSDASNVAYRKKLVVVSDFTAGARVAGLASLAWPKDGVVDLERVTPTHPGDAGLEWLGWAPDTGAGPVARVRARQSRLGAVPSLQLQLRDAGDGRALGAPLTVEVAPGDAQVALVPVPAAELGRPLRLDLSGDREPYDNTLWLVHPPPRELAFTYFGADNLNDPQQACFYLERAVAGWKDPVVKWRSGDAPGVSAAAPASEVIVVDEPLNDATVASLRARVQAGAFAIVLLKDPAMVPTAAALAGENGWSAAPPANETALLGQIDFQHPLFQIFAQPRFSDFTHVHFWKPQAVVLPADTKATVVARFDDDSPAVLEAAVGRGRLVVWGGDWTPTASQWVLSTKFVPWLEALGERAAGGPARPAVAEVGDAARLAGPGLTRWHPELVEGAAWTDTAPEQPGIYEVESGGARRLVALEVPASASNIERLPLETFEQLGVPLGSGVAGIASAPEASWRDATAVALEGRQKLWRWLLLAVVALLALESVGSLVVARRAARAEAAVVT
jgi:hypothetical protein